MKRVRFAAAGPLLAALVLAAAAPPAAHADPRARSVAEGAEPAKEKPLIIRFVRVITWPVRKIGEALSRQKRDEAAAPVEAAVSESPAPPVVVEPAPAPVPAAETPPAGDPQGA
jgi:hypothetical protein